MARPAGLRTSALRYYEDAGILPAPTRISGQRRYDADVVRRIDLLRFAQQAGFTLDEIKTLFHGFGADTPLSTRWRSLVRTKLRELDVSAERVQRMRKALELSSKCGCVRIEDGSADLALKTPCQTIRHSRRIASADSERVKPSDVYLNACRSVASMRGW